MTELLWVNCRHSYGPYFPGITELPTIEKTRNGMTSEEHYKATQKQRGYERKIRDTKQEVAALEASGADATQKRLELGKLQNQLKAHVDSKGLVRQPAREKAYGLGADVTQPRALRTSTIGKISTQGTVGVKVDKFVSCLEDRNGNIFKTESIRLLSDDLKGINKKNGWFINWEKEAKGMEVYGLRLAGDKEIQGLISLVDDPENTAVKLGWVVSAPHNRGDDRSYYGVGAHMFAIAAQRSTKLGYNGYMWGMAKTEKLARYYESKIGATRYGSLYIRIDEAAAKALLDRYTWSAL